MTAALAIKHIALVDVFTERAEARAYLWSIGEFELGEAVDQLEYDAAQSGLVDAIGEDRVQEIFVNAFRKYRDAD